MNFITILAANGSLKTDYSLEELDIVLKGTCKFISGFIQVGVQYRITFNLCFSVNEGRSFDHIIKLKDVNELNRFVNSDYQGILTRVNFYRSVIKGWYPSKDYGECELTNISVELRNYSFGEHILPI